MKSWWFGASLALAAALAACSGNIGGGSSTLPGSGASPISQVAQPTATPTPLQANDIITYGDPRFSGPQPLPTIAGYGGTITLPTPSAAATPKGGQQPVAIGLTAGIVEPTDAPDFDPKAAARKKNFLLGMTKADKSAPVPLFFITLIATSDVTFSELPKIAIDVPRDIVLKYRSGSFGLALFDPAKKSKRYELTVAELDVRSPAPAASAAALPSPSPVASASPTAAPTLRPGQSPTPLSTAAPKPSPTLPPQRVAFMNAPTELQLVANRPVVFALYAVPVPKPSPSPSPKPSAKPHPSAAPAGSPSPAGSSPASPAPTGSPQPATSASATSAAPREPSPLAGLLAR
jgi:hypothetical protein